MRTDVHTHIFPPRVAAKAVARLADLGFTPVGDGTLDDLLARAGRAGLERVVCHTVAMTADQVRPANNFMIGLARREKARPSEIDVIPFGTVHPDYERWPEELDRLEQAGIRGLKLHPDFQSLAYDDPRLFPLIEAAESRFVFMCHVGGGRPREKNPAGPHRLIKLIGLFPKARIIAAHLGGSEDAAALDILAGKDVWLDTSNTARAEETMVRAIIAKHPFERLLYGSDYPLFDPGAEVLRQRERFRLTDGRMEALMRNADALLG